MQPLPITLNRLDFTIFLLHVESICILQKYLLDFKQTAVETWCDLLVCCFVWFLCLYDCLFLLFDKFRTECADGTFGVDCEWVCNCQLASEVCNKSTGECHSGCRTTFAGLDCQIRELLVILTVHKIIYICVSYAQKFVLF